LGIFWNFFFLSVGKLTIFSIFSGNFAKISIPQFFKKTLGVEKYYTNSPTQLGAAFLYIFFQFCDVAQVANHSHP
jgi:hypothetical protein